MKPAHGTSLAETLVVMVIVVILAAIAAPSFTGMIGAQQIRQTTHTLAEALTQARLAALQRGDTVIVAPVDGDWRRGWEVFVDRDGDRRPGPRDEPIARHGALAPDIRVAMGFSMPDRDGYIAYAPSGRSCRADAASLPRWGTLTLANGTHVRRIKVNFLGRHRVCNPAVDKADCDGPDPQAL